MIFGGIQKNSLIDYPSKVSCVLFTQGCNFRCPYCHNPQLVNLRSGRSPIIEQKEVITFLSSRKNWLDGVVITGGEPTLQENLFGFCERLKDMGLSVKLDTNGSRPDILCKLISARMIDYVAMDVKTDPNRYAPVFSDAVHAGGIHESINIILASGMDHEFRTTCVKSFMDTQTISVIGQSLAGAGRYVLQQMQWVEGRVFNPGFFDTHEWQLDAESLMTLRDIAAGFVGTCIIRWAPHA